MNRKQAIEYLKPIIDNLTVDNQWILKKKSLVMAQILCESGNLKHTPGNNALGIKWTSHYPESMKQMLWTHEWVGGKYVKVQCPFVKFESIEQCIEQGYIRVLNLNRYKETRESPDWWDATNFIRLNGYATSKTYSNTLRNIIIKNKIYKIDWYHDYDEPITKDFVWGETFSSVRFNNRTYRRVIEPPEKFWTHTELLAEQLQVGRDYIEKPFVINSFYRTNEFNAYTGGVVNSQHRISNGADVRVPRGYTGYEFYRVMDTLTNCTGFGIGRTYCHFDRKKVQRKRVWYY